MDYFFWSYVNSLVYVDKLNTRKSDAKLDLPNEQKKNKKKEK